MAINQQERSLLCRSVSLCSSSHLVLPRSTTLPGFPGGSRAPQAASGLPLCTANEL
jgi:hypothetical protein